MPIGVVNGLLAEAWHVTIVGTPVTAALIQVLIMTPILRIACPSLLVVMLVGCDASRLAPVNSVDTMRRISTNGYQFDFQGKQANREESGTLGGPFTSVIVENQFGDVTVAVTDEPAHWKWKITCWSQEEATAAALTEQVKLEMSGEAGEHTWKLVLPPAPCEELTGVESILTLYVPANVQVTVANAHGDCTVNGVTESVTLKCRHGNLVLNDLAGELQAETGHGKVQAERIAQGKVSNSHGGIEIRNASGTLNVTTSHGKITLDRVAGAAQVQNSHGDIQLSGIEGPVEAETSHGRLQVENAAAAIRLKNRHGAVVVDGGNAITVETSHNSIQVNSAAESIRCQNEHGQIKVTATNPQLRRLTAQTSFGELAVRLAAESTPLIEAGTSHGDIDSAFPVLQLNEKVDNFANADPSAARVTLQNRHGNIKVNK